MKQTRIRNLARTAIVAITVLAATGITLIVVNIGRAPVPAGSHSEVLDQPSHNLGTAGISATAAADLARSHVMEGAIFDSAVAGKYRDVFTIPRAEDRYVDKPDRLVWAVTFNADFEICPPNGAPCWPPRPGQIQVILDYFTGEFLRSSSYSPP
jgi:hypothetical protein